MISYTVRCKFDNADVATRWVAWLREEHLAEVLAAGAQTAQLLRSDDQPETYEIRYSFASRKDFETYVQEHAPRLRAEGLAKFPAELGLHYTRTSGEVIATMHKWKERGAS